MLKRATAALAAMAVAGCAMTPERFYAQREKLSDGQVCDTVQVAAELRDEAFSQALIAEIGRRNLSQDRCEEIANEERLAAAILIGLLAVGAAAAAGGGGGGNSFAPTTDYSWAWDQFANESGFLVWACRGRQTGQFADLYRCSGLLKVDSVWPGPRLR